ncbi:MULTISPECIES: acyltransferase family protein [Sphingomonas]|uniref:acyltransferase family protein n=1 Tax=Sphingomonas TaxID=13687 RepID=UPI002F9145D0
MAAVPATAPSDAGGGRHMTSPELRALTSVRGLAAWLVVLFHIRGSMAGLPAAAKAVLAKGYLAVDFFFLLSGFVIWLTYAERLRAEGPGGVPRFLWRRIARIWPLHLVMLGGGVALALLLAATGRHDPARFPFDELPLHILLVQNWGMTDALSWNDPAWSISCELAAYLVFPWAVFAVDWRRLQGWALVGAIAGMITLLHLVMQGSGATTLGSDITRLGVARCLAEFGAGTAVAALWQRWRGRREALAGALATSAGAATCWALGWPETLAVPAMFAAALLALALSSGAKRHPLEGGAIHYLGTISYSTYLVHFLLFFAFKLVLVRDASNVPLPLIALYLALVLVSSIWLFHWVERPAQRLLASWNGRAPILKFPPSL